MKVLKKMISSSKSDRTQTFWKTSCKRVGKEITSPKLKNMTHAFFNLYADEKSLWKRHSLSFAYALENEPVALFDNEYLVGQLYHANHPENTELGKLWEGVSTTDIINKRKKKEIPELEQLVWKTKFDNWVAFGNCSPGHIGWHWNWIVTTELSV